MKIHRWLARGLVGLVCLCAAATVGAADLKEIQERGVLRHLGIPYANFITADGQGFDVEMVQGFAREIGVRYELVYSDFINIIRDLLGQEVVRKDGEVSLSGDFPVRGDIIATGFTILPWREKVLLYSAPTFPSQVLAVTRTESAHDPVPAQSDLPAEIRETRKLLGGKSLLVMEKTCLDPANYDLKDAGIDLRPYTASTNLSEMVPALLADQADFTLLDVPDALIDLQRWEGRIKVIGPVSELQDLAVAFPRSSPQLRAAFDQYLTRIKGDGTYDKLVNKYYPGVRHYFPDFFARKP
ncbi:MAG: transporter substrate-binding domain-containing protein [Sphingobacteriia bacterium]|nr:transporter substrate-binding domain-containing protein [Sphingobacteriia bacterium]NCC39381.1 transporter substrate-binding domain-containing protein [Gammaproteobacteria bacterium]